MRDWSSVPGIGYRSTVTLTRIKQFPKMNAQSIDGKQAIDGAQAVAL